MDRAQETQVLNGLQKLRVSHDKISAFIEANLIPLMHEHSEYRHNRAAELKAQQHPDCMGQSLIEADEKHPNEGAAHRWVPKLAASGFLFWGFEVSGR